RHAALDAASRSVEVRVDGPPPLGAWWVTVPVLPVAEAGLPIARRGRAAVTRQGVRLAVERAAADGERTAVSLTASFGPAVRLVRGLGQAHGTGPGVVLLDNRRREHVRLADAGQRSFDGHRFEL